MAKHSSIIGSESTFEWQSINVQVSCCRGLEPRLVRASLAQVHHRSSLAAALLSSWSCSALALLLLYHHTQALLGY